MIEVSKSQLSQVEYLISQSIQGNHILFDPSHLRQAFADAAPLTEEEAYSVEHHIERLILEPTIEQKRAYLEQLERETLDRVIRTYFNIVENNLYENDEVRH
jgi:hypothetical protein